MLDAGVKFYAALGNHDDAALQRNYKPFNMNGERFYSFRPQNGVRFFALDSNYVDKAQLEWLDKELAASGSGWKIMFFHHPLYSSGETHGSAEQQRALLEPLFLKHGVNVVLSGHEHFYERIKPQKGIAYFIIGSSAKLRKGDLQKSDLTAFGDDSEYAFMLMEIAETSCSSRPSTRAGRRSTSAASNASARRSRRLDGVRSQSFRRRSRRQRSRARDRASRHIARFTPSLCWYCSSAEWRPIP